MSGELHCHSFYSVDGWAVPEQVAEAAAAAGVSTLSLTDHNSVCGLGRARTQALALGLRFIDGVELDVTWRGSNYHTLAFGFDPGHARVLEVCAHNRRCYELDFGRWAPILARRWSISADGLRAGLHERYPGVRWPVLNRWFALDYMVQSGIFPDRAAARDAMQAVAREAEAHLSAQEIWPWASLEQARDAVHGAGGVLLLAHVGGFADTLRGQLQLVSQMLEAGLDGFELFHPANTRFEHFSELASHARRMGCAVSGGSDSHGVDAGGPGGCGHVPVPDWTVQSIDTALRQRRNRELRCSERGETPAAPLGLGEECQ